MADRVFGVVLMVIVAAFWVESTALPGASGGAVVGPAFLPRVVLGIIFALAVMVLVQSLIRPHQAVSFTGITGFFALHWRVPALLALIASYIALMDATGFVIASTVFLIGAFALLIRERSRGILWTAAVVSLGLPVTLNWAFESLLRTVLP